MTKAAGILIRTKSEGQVLYLKRGPGGDYPGYWCFPGGRQEEGESIEECALRECKEEIGSVPKAPLSFLCRSVSYDPARPVDQLDVESRPSSIGEAGGFPPLTPASPPANDQPHEVDFTTFCQVVDDKFPVVQDGEHVGYAWAPANEPPQPIHPGCLTALDALKGNELDIARMMAADRITSPYKYKSMTLFKMRVSGTGMAYRRAKRDDKGKLVRKGEFVWRSPEAYLNDNFVARCGGLPVIYYHPEKKSVIDSKEFNERVVGAIMFAFIQGDEVWCIARIYDDDAIAIMLAEDMSTSPGVVLGDPADNPKIKLEDGSIVLIENEPSLLDHLAICKQGVWDKEGEPAGIVVHDSNEKELTMADEEKKEEAKHDANSEKLDAIMDAVTSMKDGFEKRMDALSSRMDAVEAEKKDRKDSKKDEDGDGDADDKKTKKDSDKEEGDKGTGEEEGEAKKVAADAKKDAKKDSKKDESEEEEEKEKKDSVKHDSVEVSALRKEIEELRAKIPMALTDQDYSQLTAEQARADDIYNAFGKQAPRPLNGEAPSAYRRRVATELKAHSKAWKGIELSKLGDDALNIAVDQIYNDAAAAAHAPVDIEEGVEIPFTRTDRATGHRITTFSRRGSFVRDLSLPSRCVTDFIQRDARRS